MIVDITQMAAGKDQQDTPLIVLASESPRRSYLLRKAGLSFKVVPSRIDEEGVPPCAPEQLAVNLAEAKAGHVAIDYPSSWVIGADTIVVIGDTVLGKPGSPADARRMLELLSGQTHRVLTGYAVICLERRKHFAETVATEVTFKTLTPKEIDWYIRTEEPFDKAGAYAIQGIGTFLVKRIHGSYTNVIGLPVCEVIEHLIREGVVGFDQD